MGDVKQIRRLQTAATFEYGDGPGGVPTVNLTDHKDGGQFDLHPIAQYAGDSALLLLPHADQPGYAVALRVDAEAAGRLGRAFVGIQRKLEGGSDSEE